MAIQAVILSGGSGTRMWPASRESYPKQLLALASSNTMLQETAMRLNGLVDALEDTIVVTNDDYRFVIAEQLRQIGKQGTIVLEPVGRNTAPALTLAALAACRNGDDPVLLVMPADHVIQDLSAFQAAIQDGARRAEAGAFVTFGIVPDRPETGYGYIRTGAIVADNSAALELAAFVEKPNTETAQRYVSSGEYLWNSGIFVLKASRWLAAIEHFNPEMAEACRAAIAVAKDDGDFVRVDKQAFLRSPSDSIDYAVMEPLSGAAHIGRGVVIPLSAGWSDVGAWDALWQVSDKDESGNAVRGNAMLEGCKDSFVFAESRLVAGIGLKDVVVVETPDAVMVAHKNNTQDVKKIVARLKSDGKTLAQNHRKVFRPWGWYDSIDLGDRFQVKRIGVNPGAKLSLQMHHHRAEHWIVVSGTAEVTNGDKVMLLTENQSTYISLGTTHRLANPGKVPLEIIEVQSGSYLGEDDIVRFEDTYGRCE
ncbi:mannose-1-phosphate guanylyltransferase/mannose-6-phosphate isomerase [Niveibacterium sp. 24ML]|uniref:mannose-1-phosphate guanylyltransferase/mannose-6-phosphate isomerase n=1 Tax=Niveibacterium sp. 24ML TaxID=2985512 RepID=UPI00226EFEE9|nr:mannose-1-phosphate guanylyltransferase/mannose-6-phosphate isomerase [Niveibacterium sp. 24ML]MCX9158404.1 mannose-1-phosphate guanylyltransferase/mannose-6-phosphate isomerase [Niveibacterium sp. 24ML]